MSSRCLSINLLSCERQWNRIFINIQSHNFEKFHCEETIMFGKLLQLLTVWGRKCCASLVRRQGTQKLGMSDSTSVTNSAKLGMSTQKLSHNFNGTYITVYSIAAPFLTLFNVVFCSTAGPVVMHLCGKGAIFKLRCCLGPVYHPRGGGSDQNYKNC